MSRLMCESGNLAMAGGPFLKTCGCDDRTLTVPHSNGTQTVLREVARHGQTEH